MTYEGRWHSKQSGTRIYVQKVGRFFTKEGVGDKVVIYHLDSNINDVRVMPIPDFHEKYER